MRKLGFIIAAVGFPGCGLEAFVADLTDTEYGLPVSVIPGTVTNTPETGTVVDTVVGAAASCGTAVAEAVDAGSAGAGDGVVSAP